MLRLLSSRLLPPTPSAFTAVGVGCCTSSITKFTLTRVFQQEDAVAFARLTGDSNPIHTDPTAAAAAGLSGTILPGMLMAAMFPAIIGSRLPGALYLTQTLKFRKQAAVGSEITAEVTVTARSGSRLTFQTICMDTCGEVLVDGTALAIIKQ